ncbi:MAG TPA: alpha/beta fold hydrolase [Anaeromyxobacteraceae bacterium]
MLLVHGWGGRAGQTLALVPPLLRAGCAVVTFDGPAHGSSTGRTASVRDFARALAAVAERVGARAAIAHSMGAPAVALALDGGLSLDAAVFVAPPRSPVPFLDRLLDAMRAPGAVRERARARLERRIGAALADLDLGGIAPAMRTPLLILHDRADREVAWASGAEIARSWPGAELVTTEGLGHRGILASPKVSERAAEFVVRHLARCACGRLASEAAAGEPACSTCAIEQELFRRGR